MQFDDKVYQQIMGIPMDTKFSGFFIFFERDFMSHLDNCKRYDFIDVFNDTSRYCRRITEITSFEKVIF